MRLTFIDADGGTVVVQTPITLRADANSLRELQAFVGSALDAHENGMRVEVDPEPPTAASETSHIASVNANEPWGAGVVLSDVTTWGYDPDTIWLNDAEWALLGRLTQSGAPLPAVDPDTLAALTALQPPLAVVDGASVQITPAGALVFDLGKRRAK